MNDLIKMIPVQGGTFHFGDKVSVTVSDFKIGKYPVTQKQWREIMGNNPSYFKGDDLPVETVSWYEAVEFIQKLNKLTGKTYRLPTEAEWEYAARGGAKSKGFLYAGGMELDKVAWYEGNSNDKTHPVGSKAPNELGLYDMSGNVWEWCADWYGDYAEKSEIEVNPRGPGEGAFRVHRGGGWYNYAGDCRMSIRGLDAPGYRGGILGFRLAM